jgi:hypothetical protein
MEVRWSADNVDLMRAFAKELVDLQPDVILASNTPATAALQLLATVGGAKSLRLIVLDACRNNPFKDRMRRTAVVRTATDRGLAPPPETDAGTLVVYSAKDGDVAADDVGGANSPFALAFMAEMKVPGREVDGRQ